MNLPSRIHATARERAQRLPGDDVIPHTAGALTHAITVTENEPPHWLVLEKWS